MIKLQVIGSLGKDCIVKEINGKNVINFSVANTERYKDAQGVLKEKTTWVECAYWTDRTAIAPYLLKGQQVYIEGTPDADAYLNKENQPAATLRMRVQNVQLLGSKNSGEGQQANASSNNYSSANQSQPAPQQHVAPMPNVAVVADDLPF